MGEGDPGGQHQAGVIHAPQIFRNARSANGGGGCKKRRAALGWGAAAPRFLVMILLVWDPAKWPKTTDTLRDAVPDGR